MRVLVFAVLFVLLFLCGDALGSGCSLDNQLDAEAARSYCFLDEEPAGELASSAPYSAFRGIGLASRPDDVQRIGQALGYEVETSLFVGESAIASVSLYANCQLVAQAAFEVSAVPVSKAAASVVRKIDVGMMVPHEMPLNRLGTD